MPPQRSRIPPAAPPSPTEPQMLLRDVACHRQARQPNQARLRTLVVIGVAAVFSTNFSGAASSAALSSCPPQWLPTLLAYTVPLSPPPSLPPSSLPPPAPPPPPRPLPQSSSVAVSRRQSPPPSSPSTPSTRSRHYTFAHGTFQPPPSGPAAGCTDLDSRLSAQHLAEAVDVCFDAQFSCSHAEPFVGMAMVRGLSEGSSQTGEQASIQIEGSDTWLPALVPVHAPRGSRHTTSHSVPVVGCFVDNTSRFVLSWADIRCRSLATGAPFPAECDGGGRRNVAIEDATAAVSFVESLTPGLRRKLDLGDHISDHVKGTRTAVIVLVSPSDAKNASDPWNYSAVARNHTGSASDWVDAVVPRSPPACSPPLLPLPRQHV